MYDGNLGMIWFSSWLVQREQKSMLQNRDYKNLVFGNKINLLAQRGARTHDPEIKSLMLYRLS